MIFRDIIKQLYVYCGGDTIELGRHALGVVQPAEDKTGKLSRDDLMVYLQNMESIRGNRDFQETLGYLTTAQVKLIAERASPTTLDFARGTLNGIALVREELESAHLRLKAMTARTELDKFNVI